MKTALSLLAITCLLAFAVAKNTAGEVESPVPSSTTEAPNAAAVKTVVDAVKKSNAQKKTNAAASTPASADAFAQPGATTAVVRCTVDVSVTASTQPGIGNEGWWEKNYGVMETFFNTCGTADTSATLTYTETKQVLSLPRDHILKFDRTLGGDNKIPYVFLPIFGSDVQNLPGQTATFAAVLDCRKTWLEQKINLKSCTLVSTML